jgi:hypothetical protein
MSPVELVTLCPLTASTVVWGTHAGEWRLTVCVKATFSLAPGTSVLADAQDVAHDDIQGDQSPHASLHAPSDFAPFKPSADILLSGHAYAPPGGPVEELFVELRVGGFSKALRVIGDRAWVPAREGLVPSRAQPFTRMPLRYERAARRGDNLAGLSSDSASAAPHRPLPNIEATDAQSLYATPGYGPISPRWRAARYELSEEAFVWAQRLRIAPSPAPARFDARFFNAAPRDQQVERLDPALTIALRNLSPRAPYLETRLPDVRPKVFYVDIASGRPIAMALSCDTLWIDTDREVAVLSWRGAVPVAGPDDRAIGRILIAAPPAGTDLRYEEVERLAGDRRGGSEAPPLPAKDDPRLAINAAATIPPNAHIRREPLPWSSNPPSPRSDPTQTIDIGPLPSRAPAELPFAQKVEAEPAVKAQPTTSESAPPPHRSPDQTLDFGQFWKARSAPLPFMQAPEPQPLPSNAPTPSPPLEIAVPVIHVAPEVIEEKKAPSVPPPPMVGPLAIAASAPEEAPAVQSATPDEAMDEAPPSPADFPIEECAAITAEIDIKPESLSEILKKHTLTEPAWADIERHVAQTIQEQTERDDTTVLEAFDAAYVKQIEEERGQIHVEEYARILGRAGRGSGGPALGGVALPREGLMRIKRVGLRRMMKDSVFAALLARAIVR